MSAGTVVPSARGGAVNSANEVAIGGVRVAVALVVPGVKGPGADADVKGVAGGARDRPAGGGGVPVARSVRC